MNSTEFINVSAAAWSTSPVNAMTVDVEDYFHVSAFEEHIARAEWSRMQLRVAESVDRILELFGANDVRATFFVLGWLAKRMPSLVQRIACSGHEIASHGFSHIRIGQQSSAAFRNDVLDTKHLLEDTIGTEIIGYRAPSYSINAETLWALDVLAETGHRYSSSIYPIRHDLYGMPDAPRFAFRPRGASFTEVPVSTVALFGRNWPCGGGGYFRLLPYQLSRWAVRRINEIDRQPAVFYFHPWELDPEQPRIRGIGMKTRFRHYFNLGRVEQRLGSLLSDFAWHRVDTVFNLRCA